MITIETWQTCQHVIGDIKHTKNQLSSVRLIYDFFIIDLIPSNYVLLTSYL